MGKNNVLIYTEWLEDLEDLEDQEISVLFQNILRYQAGMQLLDMTKSTNIVFKPIRRCIDKDNSRYITKCEKNKQISQEYWEKRKGKKNRTDSNDTERIRTISDNDNENDKDNDNDNEYIDIYTYIYKNFSNSDLIDALKDFIQVRKQLNKPITQRAIKLCLSKLNELSKDESTQLQIINQSIMWGSPTFHPLDSKIKSKGKKPFTGRDYDFELLEGELTKNG